MENSDDEEIIDYEDDDYVEFKEKIKTIKNNNDNKIKTMNSNNIEITKKNDILIQKNNDIKKCIDNNDENEINDIMINNNNEEICEKIINNNKIVNEQNDEEDIKELEQQISQLEKIKLKKKILFNGMFMCNPQQRNRFKYRSLITTNIKI